jgi:alpha-glucan,water dikinase
MGSPVWPTRFLPMKTPMSNEILSSWSLAEAPKHPLTVPRLLETQSKLGRTVGLIIDLANHDCL